MNLERYFTELGVVFERVPALPVEQIDQVKSYTNQARVKPVDDPTVERYMLDLEAGDEFPPVIVHRRSQRSKLVLLGGNHRYAAHLRLGRKTIDAYVVECDEVTAVRITYEDNRNHGLTLTQDERIAHATHLIDLGWKLAPAARVAGLSANMVDRSIAVTRVDRRALELGLDVQAFTRLARTGRWRLASLKDDRVFVAAAKLCVAARCTPDEIYTLVTDLNALGTAQLALDAIAVRREKWADRIRTGRKHVSSTSGKLNEACFTLTTLPVPDIVKSCRTLEEKVALSRRCSEAVVHLGKVIAQLGVKARAV